MTQVATEVGAGAPADTAVGTVRPGESAQVAAPEVAGWRARRRLGWVMSQGRALAVRVDEPVGPMVGAVVVAPSAGREAVVSFRTTRALAHRAAQEGFVAFTFAWSGEGDSHDLAPGDDLAAAWVADLAAVIGQARDLVGPDLPVHVVGLRLGASVAAALPWDAGLPGERVLWEPISGRSFLRHHRMIRAESVPVPPVERGVELEGSWFDDDQAASLASLRAPRLKGAPAPPTTVRMERDRRAALRIALGAPYFAHVPLASVREVVAGLPRGEAVPARRWNGPVSATSVRPDGTRVVETWTGLGPGRLPAIVASSPDVTPHVGLAFTAMGAELKDGPGRLWATASRELAARGALCVRADRGLIGDDAEPEQAAEPRPYTDRSVADVAHVATFLRRQGLPAVGVGLCAGGWSLLRAQTAGAFDTVVAVNPVHWNPAEAAYDEAFYAHYHGADAPSGSPESAAAQEDSPTSARARLGRLAEAASREMAIRFPRLRSALRPDVPLDLAGMILDDVPAGASLVLLFGDEEHRIFRGKGGERALRAARRRGVDARVVRDPAFDHSLFSRSGREGVRAFLHALVDDRAEVGS